MKLISKPVLVVAVSMVAAPAFAVGPVQIGVMLSQTLGASESVIEAMVEHCKGAAVCSTLKQKCKDNRGTWSPLQTNGGGRTTIGSCTT